MVKRIGVGFWLLYSSTIVAQVDAYKMRNEISAFQFKPQPQGEITQRATILDTNASRASYEANIADILRHNSELYFAPSSYSHIHFYYRGNRVNQLLYDNVSISSINPNLLSYFIYSIDKENIAKYEILYGNNLPNNSVNNSAIVALQPNISELNLTERRHQLSGYIRGGHLAQAAGVQWRYKQNNWSNDMRFGINRNDKYIQPHTTSIYPAEHRLQVLNTFQKKISSDDIIKAHLQFSLATPNLILGEANSSTDSLQAYKSNSSPFVFSYLQWVKQSDEALWYDRIITSLSYIYSQAQDSIIFKGNYLPRSSQLHTHKFSLQTNGYKNIGSRAVYTYGWNLGLELPHMESNRIENISIRPSLSIPTHLYFKKEIRQSSDVSWILAARLGAEYLSIKEYDARSFDWINTDKVLPNASIQAAWTRHTCENSNYSLNLFIHYISPAFEQFKPVFSKFYFTPNLDIKAEKQIGFEGNLYRKFFEKLEWNLSAFYMLRQDAIYTRDYYGEGTRWVSYSGIRQDILQNVNVALSSQLGINNELKFHLNSSCLFYHTIHFQQQFIFNDTNQYSYPNIPIYGNVGIKLKLDKLYAQLWINYNLGRNMLSNPTRYEASYGLSSLGFQPYYMLDCSASYQPNQWLTISGKLDNIFNRDAFNYLAQLPNIGRSASLELRVNF